MHPRSSPVHDASAHPEPTFEWWLVSVSGQRWALHSILRCWRPCYRESPWTWEPSSVEMWSGPSRWSPPRSSLHTAVDWLKTTDGHSSPDHMPFPPRSASSCPPAGQLYHLVRGALMKEHGYSNSRPSRPSLPSLPLPPACPEEACHRWQWPLLVTHSCRTLPNPASSSGRKGLTTRSRSNSEGKRTEQAWRKAMGELQTSGYSLSSHGTGWPDGTKPPLKSKNKYPDMPLDGGNSHSVDDASPSPSKESTWWNERLNERLDRGFSVGDEQCREERMPREDSTTTDLVPESTATDELFFLSWVPLPLAFLLLRPDPYRSIWSWWNGRRGRGKGGKRKKGFSVDHPTHTHGEEPGCSARSTQHQRSGRSNGGFHHAAPRLLCCR